MAEPAQPDKEVEYSDFEIAFGMNSIKQKIMLPT